MTAKLNISAIFVLACFAALSQNSGTPAQEPVTPETVIIKMMESYSFGILNNIDSRLIIVDADNHLEEKPLKRVNYNTDFNEGVESNTQKLRLELQIWQNKGYTVKGMSSVSPKDFITITTIILQKG